MLRKWFHETDIPPPPKSVKSTGTDAVRPWPEDPGHRPFILTEVVAVGSG